MRSFGFNKIKFQALNEMIESVQSHPAPSASHIPSWYKQMRRYVGDSDKPIKSLGAKDLKTCFPFRDALLTGYFVLLPADLEVTISDSGQTDVWWNQSLPFELVESRGSTLTETNQGFGMPVPHGCNPTMFAWRPFYSVGVDFSYSILVTHPLNRHDLPFVTTSGIMETAGIETMAGNIPFFFKEGFSGIIPKGTPIAQIIPFKRENWQSEITPRIDDERKYQKLVALRDSYIEGFYGKFIRQPKVFK